MGWSQTERELTLTRVRRSLDRHLRPGIHGPGVPLSVTAHHVRGEPVDVTTALEGDYVPFEVGQRWGPPWGTTWFRMTGRIPRSFAGHDVVARVRVHRFERTGFGAEGLVWMGGRPIRGLSPNHDVIPLFAPAVGGETVDFHVEAAANPRWHLDDGRPGIAGLPTPDPDAPPMCELEYAELTTRHRHVSTLAVTMEHLLELVGELSADDPRANQLLAALTEACRLIDPDDVVGSARTAGAALEPALTAPAVHSAHHITAIGHAHIDTAWLWPVRETIRKASRTFATVLALMDEDPDFRFVCSQPQQYEWTRQHYPELFDRIKQRIIEGRWEPVGSMWVEADCNIPSGESLVRQIVHGKRFFLEHFDVETRDVFLPDVFGYSPALPQLMKLAGIDYFLSTKLSWNQINTFPHDSFWWEGLDGSRVLTHFPPADTYNGDMSPRELLASVRGFAEQDQVDTSVYPFGWGDGGGGPTPEMLERLRLSENLEGLPRVTPGSLVGFFDDLASRAEHLPVWVGELYFELHRGTYTSQARMKRDNRRAEHSLRRAELWSALLDPPTVYPAAELDAAWKRVLLQQFHDIIPGSSIGWVYDDAARDHEAALATTDAISRDVLQRAADEIDTHGLGRPLVVFNALSHERRELLDTDQGPRMVQVPPLGYTTIDLDADPDRAGEADQPVTSGPGWVQNRYLRVAWDDRGSLTSIYDLEADREVLAAGHHGNLLQLHRDEPNDHDAWDIDRFYLDDTADITAAELVEPVAAPPHRAGVRIVRSFGRSRIEQRLILAADSRRLDVHTDVDWHERHKVLKVAFPVAVRAADATFEVQFGHVRRPTHENTSWDRARFEVCAQRWADLSETGYGVALLNDGKYGYDVRGHTLRLTLLRAPTSPDPDADQGRHRFTYALYPHVGGPLSGGVIEAAAELNEPLQAVAATPGRGLRPRSGGLAAIDRRGVVIETVKRADDGSGDLVIRVYDAWGQRGPVRLTLDQAAEDVMRCDLLERPQTPIGVAEDGCSATVDLAPFEVVTLRARPRPSNEPAPSRGAPA